jgi:glycosyltransferase involved in cell wall biosynthesis
MKIAYIILKGMPLGGGIEKYTEEVGSRLAERGHEIIVYTMKHYGAEDGLYKGMRVKSISTLRTRSLEKLTASFIATIYQLIEKDIDIVHFHAFGPSMFCIIPRIIGRKVVVQGHGLEWNRSKWGKGGRLFLRLSEVPSVKFPHSITVVSKVQQRYLRNEYGIESTYIPTGVNSPIQQSPYLIRKKYGLLGNDYILFAARLVSEKGAHYLIDAYNGLKTDLKLVIAGDAQHEEDYKNKLYKITGGSEKIIFLGFVTGRLLAELYSNCYLYALPSEIEGMPITLLEAMSYGNCCIASDIDENIEVLQHYGYTFKNKDVVSLRKTLQLLITEPSRLEQKKKDAAYYVLSNFSWDSIASKFEKLYEELLFKSDG